MSFQQSFKMINRVRLTNMNKDTDFHALLKVCSDCDDTAPLTVHLLGYIVL